jgi:hypothetical protein
MNQSEVLGKGTVGAVDDVAGKDKRESVFRLRSLGGGKAKNMFFVADKNPLSRGKQRTRPSNRVSCIDLTIWRRRDGSTFKVGWQPMAEMTEKRNAYFELQPKYSSRTLSSTMYKI